MELLTETKTTKQKYVKVKSTFPQIWRYEKDSKDYFLVNGRSRRWGLNIRKSFNSEKQSRDYVRELERQMLEKGNKVSENPVYNNSEIEKLIDRLKPWGESLKDCVDFRLQWREEQLKLSIVPPIKELCETWYIGKRDSTLKPLKNRTMIELNSFHKFIQHHFGKLKPSDVNKEQVETVLSKSYGQNVTRKKRLTYIRMFFKWCMDKKYISSNPTDGIQVTVPKKEVEIWGPEKISQLLTIVEEKYPSLLGYYILCTFGGLRPSESQRVEWKDINFEGKEIYVKKGKTDSRRFVLKQTSNNETETLWAWLNHFKQMNPNGTFNPLNNTHGGLQKKVRKEVPFEWEQDVLRHSFGTYYYNLIHDLGKVVHDMGNSEQICKRYYVREVRKSWTEEFWGLRPKGNTPTLVGTLTEENPESINSENTNTCVTSCVSNT